MKILIKTFIILSTNFCCMYPMEHVDLSSVIQTPHKEKIEIGTLLKPITTAYNKDMQYSITAIHDIPMIPLLHIYKSLNTIKGKIAAKNESLLFHVMNMPPEITAHIIFLMLNKDIQSTQIFLNTPVLYSFQRYHKANNLKVMLEHRMFHHNDELIAKKPLTIETIFRLSHKGLLELNKFITSITFNEIVLPQQHLLSKEQLNTLELFLLDNTITLFDDEEMRLINHDINQPNVSCTTKVVFGTLIGIFINAAITVPLTIIKKDDLIVTAPFILMGSLFGSTILSIFFTATVSTLYEKYRNRIPHYDV